jgi:hypothetical protein
VVFPTPRDRDGLGMSWFRVVPQKNGGTQLQFGSGVASGSGEDGSPRKLAFGVRLMQGFHVLYSKVLLWAASRRGWLPPD